VFISAKPPENYVRFEPDEDPPFPVAVGAALQAAAIIVAPVALTVVIVARIAQQPESYISWGVFAALVISGITTALQAIKVGRFGSGHVLVMGTSGAFIAVCVAALVQGGPATMASLIIVSSFFQFLMARRLSLLRRVFTPVVSGTVIMLIAATVVPVLFDSLTDVPEEASSIAAPIASTVTLAVVAGLILRAPPAWRLWSPVIGIAVGCAVGAPFGIYNPQPVLDAPWVGAPIASWPGFDFALDTSFWALLPAFIVVTLVGAIETLGDGVAIQRVSRRQSRATDYRVVQGALNADGVGNLLSGIAGTLPNTTYSSSISLAEVTGIAARRVGVIIGAVFVGVAFFPKVAALLISIPPPVAASYILVLLGMLFAQGMKIVISDGLDHRKAVVVGAAFWLGVGFQNQWIFPDLLGEGFLAVLLGNGMTSGAIIAIVMMLFMEATGPKRRRLELTLDREALPSLTSFLQEFANRAGWVPSEVERLVLVGEETLSSLWEEDETAASPRHLVVTVRVAGGGAEFEFLCGSDRENLEDGLSFLAEAPDVADTREMSFRLLRHYASSVRHQKYHDIDVITVNVEPARQ
jgi:NCS2 family nucleobase:cation symporter-2/xanthine permease XanP